MKKTILTTCVLCLSLTGCGDDSSTPLSTTLNSVSSTASSAKTLMANAAEKTTTYVAKVDDCRKRIIYELGNISNKENLTEEDASIILNNPECSDMDQYAKKKILASLISGKEED